MRQQSSSMSTLQKFKQKSEDWWINQINMNTEFDNSPNETKRNLLFNSAAAGYKNLFTFLIESKGLNFSTTDGDGCNVLHIAFYSGQLDFINHLIEKKYYGTLNIVDKKNNWLPVHYAIMGGYWNIVDLNDIVNTAESILAKQQPLPIHVYMSLPDFNPQTAIKILEIFSNTKGFDINVKDSNENNMLHLASQTIFYELQKLYGNDRSTIYNQALFYKGLNTTKLDDSQKNIEKYLPVLEWLLRKGIEITPNQENKFFLDYLLKIITFDLDFTKACIKLARSFGVLTKNSISKITIQEIFDNALPKNNDANPISDFILTFILTLLFYNFPQNIHNIFNYFEERGDLFDPKRKAILEYLLQNGFALGKTFNSNQVNYMSSLNLDILGENSKTEDFVIHFRLFIALFVQPGDYFSKETQIHLKGLIESCLNKFNADDFFDKNDLEFLKNILDNFPERFQQYQLLNKLKKFEHELYKKYKTVPSLMFLAIKKLADSDIEVVGEEVKSMMVDTLQTIGSSNEEIGRKAAIIINNIQNKTQVEKEVSYKESKEEIPLNELKF